MIYFLTGTTASGKSTLAHQLAIENEMKIISLDSMAVYKGIDILSDKPDKKMQEEVQYFGIDIVDQKTNFTVFDYISYLSEMNLDKISYNEDLIAVGGTGLYFNAIVNSYKLKKTNSNYREHLENLTLENLKELYIKNFSTDDDIDMDNKRRLIRALESNNEESLDEIINFDLPIGELGVFWSNTDIENRIQNRTHRMISNGLIEEVTQLTNPSRTVQQAIGYSESTSAKNTDEIINEINKKTLKLAKKQKTWFKKIKNILYMETESFEEVENKMKDIIHG